MEILAGGAGWWGLAPSPLSHPTRRHLHGVQVAKMGICHSFVNIIRDAVATCVPSNLISCRIHPSNTCPIHPFDTT
jgi:hypothetical protein